MAQKLFPFTKEDVINAVKVYSNAVVDIRSYWIGGKHHHFYVEIGTEQFSDNGKYQYSEWEEDGKGFNEGFAEINFGSGAMMRLPITYKVVAWRPLADVINELSDHGFISTQDNPILSKRLVDCELSVRTLNICHANGIETLGDLCKLHKTDWLKFRNSGRKSLAELDDLLHDNGLDWAEWH